MKKTTLTLGLALAFAAAGTAAAQSTQPRAKAEQGARGERGGRGQGEFRGRRGPGGPGGFLLRGITLTDAQKTQLKELRKANDNKADREQFRTAMTEARALRQKGDTAAARAKMQQVRAAFDKDREQEIAAIRNILTAEQRTKFDANVAEAKQRQAQRGEGRGAKGERGQRRHGR